MVLVCHVISQDHETNAGSNIRRFGMGDKWRYDDFGLSRNLTRRSDQRVI